MTFQQYAAKIGKKVFKHHIPRLKKRGEELFSLLRKSEHTAHHPRMRRLIEWLVIPPTLWLIDYIGLSKLVAHRINENEPIDPRMLQLIDELDEPPGQEEQERAVERETALHTGNYAGLLRNPEKYNAMHEAMKNNPKRIAHWNRIREVFKLSKFRHHSNGMIRRTQYLERGIPPEDFYLTDKSNEERWLFRAVFDLYCKRYGLFAMRYDEALVERLTVTRTQFATTISIPRWMNIARDDLIFEAVQESHWHPDLTAQGPKASANELERLEMLRRIDCARTQAKAENLKGEPFRRRIEEIAKVPVTDKRVHIRWQNDIEKLKARGIL